MPRVADQLTRPLLLATRPIRQLMPTNPNLALEEIIAAIQALPPEQRRQLQRRLRVGGLFVPEIAVTDQQRLRVAPALAGRQAIAPASAARVGSPSPPDENGMVRQEAAISPPPAPDAALPHRPASSGRVVVYTPSQTAQPDDPHAMQPLPGQAPEQPIVVIFDGGSKGNPGLGYGSYALRWPGVQQQIVKLRFGNNVTNNEAEYETLIAALEAIRKRLQDSGAALHTAQLEIRGDSLLVINQVLGQWQCKEETMRTRRDAVRTLLQPFGKWRLLHHDRARSVEVLGH